MKFGRVLLYPAGHESPFTPHSHTVQYLFWGPLSHCMDQSHSLPKGSTWEQCSNTLLCLLLCVHIYVCMFRKKQYAYRLKFVCCSLQLYASMGRHGLYATYTTIYLVVYKVSQGLLCLGGLFKTIYHILIHE